MVCPNKLGGPSLDVLFHGEVASIGMSLTVVLICSVRFLHVFGVHGLVLPISGPFRGVQQVQLTYPLVPSESQMWLAGQELNSYSSMRFLFECQVGIRLHELFFTVAGSMPGKPQPENGARFTNNNDGKFTNSKKMVLQIT